MIDDPVPVPEPPDASIVVANCAALQAAVERLAASNEGIYPSDANADASPSGRTAIDLRPDGRSLPNPVERGAAIASGSKKRFTGRFPRP